MKSALENKCNSDGFAGKIQRYSPKANPKRLFPRSSAEDWADTSPGMGLLGGPRCRSEIRLKALLLLLCLLEAE